MDDIARVSVGAMILPRAALSISLRWESSWMAKAAWAKPGQAHGKCAVGFFKNLSTEKCALACI